MRKSQATCCAVIVAGLFAASAVEAADTFRKLTASEIKSKVSGMEIVDVGDHWAEQYMRNGSLKVFAMGKFTAGTWRVQNGELCVELAPIDSGCSEVWISGNQIESRRRTPPGPRRHSAEATAAQVVRAESVMDHVEPTRT